MIDRFLDNTQVPVCGSKLVIFAKRYPNETDYSRIVVKMRQHHSYLTILASNEPSGGNHPEILYDLASKTNGMCVFDDDDNILEAEDQVETVFHPSLVYAANPQVSGNGRIQLPPLLVQDDSGYFFTMMMQDNVEPDSCTASDPTTFLFAYSNDFDPSLVSSWLRYIQPNNDVLPHYSKFASIRFDTKTEEEFEYQNTFDEFVTIVDNHLPDPSLSFDNNNTGSDILQIIDRFLDNTQVPVCGSKMIICVKRYPNETDYSQIVAKMRQHHSYFTIFASTNSSGGNHPEILYDLASKTNGLCAFDDDENISFAIDYVDVCVFNPYLVYAANPQVSGNGRIQLPPLLVQSYSNYWFTMMMQDNGPMTVVQAVVLSWVNDNDDGQLGKNGTIFSSGASSGNHIGNWKYLTAESYNMQLDYNYTDSKERRVQIRVHGHEHPIDYWVPYDN
ncbi:hypothetical protein CAEBREN_08017 [Caenorhabditis brenneri]|uniref:DUF7154 domain-containing protein n=1 Tax=Caenorhabditis brenneri TaxID=135651 RepID=G0N2N1_CAEBE|nr:hypothetical protein CAEBREN_08017 [Caenorhabditis brenneri]